MALSEVSLTVRAGDIYGIVGPNGSGKTTLFNVISGLHPPDSGRVATFGTDITGARPYRISGIGVARTFQNLRLFHRLTTRDNILAACDRTRTRWSWRYVLWPVGVIRGEGRCVPARRNSSAGTGWTGSRASFPARCGTQRRIEIARAMAARPRLLLLDEPAAGLNPSEIGQLADIVRDIRGSGVIVVLIEHNMGLVMSLCDRVTVFRFTPSDGRISRSLTRALTLIRFLPSPTSSVLLHAGPRQLSHEGLESLSEGEHRSLKPPGQGEEQ